MSVNSAAVLRLTGRGSGPIAGASRGRSTSRGRGKNFNLAVANAHVVAVVEFTVILDGFALVSLNNFEYLNS